MPSPPADSSRARDVAALFDVESTGYDEAHDGPLAYLFETRMRIVLEALGSGPGDVLDAGMGPGRLVEALSDRGWTVSGIDISERMVELARARVPVARDRLLHGSITELPFGDASFDAVAATGVVEYLDDPRCGLGEMVRVLRPGGTLVVSMPHRRSLKGRWTQVWYPAARVFKRLAPAARPAPFSKPGLLAPDEIADALRAAGAAPSGVRYACAEVLPRRLAGRAGPAIARRIETAGGVVARSFATQVLVVAQRGEAPQGW